VHVVGHRVETRPTETPFRDRAGLLFVGSLHAGSPNEDAILHFIREVLPLVRHRLGCSVLVVGWNGSAAISRLGSSDVRITGPVDDLAPWYARARVFIVPTRYAAGIPIKLYEASAAGIPSVVTPLVARQVGWRDEREVLVGSTPDDFARRVLELYTDEALWDRIRSGALAAVARECASDRFVAALRAATGGLDSRSLELASHVA